MSSQLDAIKARAEAATAGPWEADQFGAAMNGRDSWHVRSSGKPGVQVFLNGTLAKDAEFIAHARSDIPALVAAVEAALNMPGEVVECGYPLDSEWVSGYNSALVDIRAAIHQALGEAGK